MALKLTDIGTEYQEISCCVALAIWLLYYYLSFMVALLSTSASLGDCLQVAATGKPISGFIQYSDKLAPGGG